VKLDAGTRLGPYVIGSAVGAGGMGEVYRGRDTRLDRTVAIKVLPSDLSRNPTLRQRFVREARAISSFTHPHVCQLYDIGTEGDVDYLVMEFLEGQSLAERLSRGALPLDQALRHATEIAQALDAAHRRGIVHRDLKPGNVILTKSGAKLVDFGLATEAPSSDASRDTTVHAPLTGEGMIVGTLQYMSPEQVEGAQLDQRSDIFAFGAVVYEMVTGRRAFAGSSQASVISAILSTDPPPMSERTPATPAALERVIRKCLSKSPDERWQCAADVATALQWIDETAPQRAAESRRMHAVVALLAAIAITAASAAVYFAVHRVQPPVIRFAVPADEPFAHGLAPHLAISPDGMQLAFVTSHSSGNALRVRGVGETTPRVVTDRHNPVAPFWSPDSRVIGYFTGTELRRVGIDGEGDEKICDIEGTTANTASWASDGTIYYATLGKPGAIHAVSAAGGTPRVLVRSAANETYCWPVVIEKAKRVLYVALASSGDLTLRAVSTDGTGDRAVGRIPTRVEYASPFLFYVEEGGSLVARRFDAQSLAFSGEAREIERGVDYIRAIGAGAFSVSPTAIATHSGAYVAKAAWYDHTGRFLSETGVRLGVVHGVALAPRRPCRVRAAQGLQRGRLGLARRRQRSDARDVRSRRAVHTGVVTRRHAARILDRARRAAAHRRPPARRRGDRHHTPFGHSVRQRLVARRPADRVRRAGAADGARHLDGSRERHGQAVRLAAHAVRGALRPLFS
jgi:tRNA A-37 threonylcarbamoyl transferase component Bud32